MHFEKFYMLSNREKEDLFGKKRRGIGPSAEHKSKQLTGRKTVFTICLCVLRDKEKYTFTIDPKIQLQPVSTVTFRIKRALNK